MNETLLDLAAPWLGGLVLDATDEFFAPKEALLRPGPAVFDPDRYTERGKEMDGWESRRKRTGGHDNATIRLGLPGRIRRLIVDTSHFRGNHPAACAVEGCAAGSDADLEGAEWVEVLPRSDLKGDFANAFDVALPFRLTHLRLHIFPDGGVARLRVLGEVVPDWSRAGAEPDLADLRNGALVLRTSDEFFGPAHQVLAPLARDMHDGWETRRRRGEGHDWCEVRLGVEGEVRRIVVDTTHFKGNFPESCLVEARRGDGEWAELLPRVRLDAHRRHLFVDELRELGPVTQLRLHIFPDGGVMRLRAFGTPTAEGRRRAGLARLESLLPGEARQVLGACCGSTAWVDAMLAARPFGTIEAVHVASQRAFEGLTDADWREAFAAHPRIGARADSGHQEATGERWSEGEQAGVRDAAAAVREELALLNQAYFDRHGFTFIVCATGLSAEEMLGRLKGRIDRSPAEELRTAAAEQAKITGLRLEKWIGA